MSQAPRWGSTRLCLPVDDGASNADPAGRTGRKDEGKWPNLDRNDWLHCVQATQSSITAHVHVAVWWAKIAEALRNGQCLVARGHAFSYLNFRGMFLRAFVPAVSPGERTYRKVPGQHATKIRCLSFDDEAPSKCTILCIIDNCLTTPQF